MVLFDNISTWATRLLKQEATGPFTEVYLAPPNFFRPFTPWQQSRFLPTAIPGGNTHIYTHAQTQYTQHVGHVVETHMYHKADTWIHRTMEHLGAAIVNSYMEPGGEHKKSSTKQNTQNIQNP